MARGADAGTGALVIVSSSLVKANLKDGQRYSPCVFMYGSSSSEWYISKVWSCIKRSLILDGPIVCCCSSHCQVKI